MGFHVQIVCDNPVVVDTCISKFTELSPSVHSDNDRADIAKKVTELREKAAFHGWKQQPNGDWFCPKCASAKK